MRIRNVFYSGLVLSIIGCSSTPVSTSYYLLNNQPLSITTSIETGTDKKTKRTIVVSIKNMPDYLEQSHLVMQMADHQLHYANFHMWAEPLKQGFQKALLSDLSSNKTKTKFIAYDRGLNQESLMQLFINIDFFHAMANSKVVLSGQFWLLASEKNHHLIKHPFYFKLNLEKDGYPHSVEQMRMLVSQLAEQIVKQN